jgi:Alpha/beta hydrolase family
MNEGYVALKLDVTGALPADVVGDQPKHVSAWIFLPDPAAMPDTPTVVSLLNGGTYDKRYWHFSVPGEDGYSAAEFLRNCGHVVILTDHLGIGESSRGADQMKVTRQVAAAANHAAIEQIYAKLRDGSLADGFPPLRDFVKIGGGHSMGGMQTITQQAEHGTFDGCLILGYTAYGVHLHFGDQVVSAHPGELDFSQPDYDKRDRKLLHKSFHWDDVAPHVIEADDALNVEVPYILSTQAISEGIVRDDAAKLRVPLYICLGERDVSPDPHREPSYYTGSTDITLHILPRSGHCQNFATTRTQMYQRMHRWISERTNLE